MPFTPFHMGPGLAVKAVSGRHFSLMVFGVSQVAMDVEPLVGMVRGDAVLHGFTHTYVGATLVALVAVVAGRPLCQFLLNFLNWARGPRVISWPAATAGALVGTYSHVFLDSVMHPDMRPLAPFSDGNALLHLIPVSSLYLACVLGGVGGALVFLGTFILRRDAPAD